MKDETIEKNLPTIGKKILDFIESRPKTSILLSLLLIGGALPGLTKLTIDLTHRAMVEEGHPLIDSLDQFERRFGNDDSVVVAVHSPSGIFDRDSVELLQQLTEQLWMVTDVIRVDSLSNFNWSHSVGDDMYVDPLLPRDQELTDAFIAERKKIALEHDMLPGYLISEDGKTALIYAVMRPGFETPPSERRVVNGVREVIDKYRRSDHVFHLVGNPVMIVAFQDSMTGDMEILVPIVSIVTLLLLFFLLKSILGVVLPLLIVTIAVVTTMGLAGYMGVVVTNLTSLLPQILLAIGVATSVHILVSFIRALEHAIPQREAARYSLAKNFMPTFLTSVSTSMGFVSFSTATVKVIGYLGMMGAVGTMVTWLSVYFLLGPLMYIAPFKRPHKTHEEKQRREKMIHGYIDLLQKYRIPFIAAAIVTTVGSIYLASQNTVNADPLKYLTEDVELRTSIDWLQDNVGGVRSIELWIDCGEDDCIKDPSFMKTVDDFQSWIEAKPYVTRTISVTNIIKSMNSALNGDDPAFHKLPDSRELIGQELFLYAMSLPQGMDINNQVSSRNDQLRMTVLWTVSDSKETIEAVEAFIAHGEGLGLDVVPTGKPWMFQALNPLVVDSFVFSISLAVVMISLLLIFFFRSVKVGLLALAPNIVPLVFGAGLLYVIGRPLDMGTTMVFAVCLGIAVDDTIHFLATFNRNVSEGRTKREAVYDVLANTSPALVTTTLILVTSFGVFGFATFSPNLYFGIFTAIILSAALLTVLSFLPALLLNPREK